jgi:rhodanese-related sulfurtransferase
MIPRLIDVREYPEFAAGHIEGAELVPLATVAGTSATWNRDAPLLLVCRSGRRAEQARQQLASLGFQHLTVLEGGIDRWSTQGKPLVSIERRPWSMERQVRIAAGSLILLTMVLAFTLSRYFLVGTAFIGAGLVFAGVSDICMMATALGALPWNRPTRSGR